MTTEGTGRNMPKSHENRPLSAWRPQPESRQGPDTFGAPGRVSGVVVCGYHRSVLGGLRTAHGSVEGHAGRVRQISSQCLDCIREQSESGA